MLRCYHHWTHFVWITSTPRLNIHRLVRGDWGANVVHRDLKPANILVRRFPSPARLWFVVKVHRFVSFCRRPNLQKSLKFRLFSTSQLQFKGSFDQFCWLAHVTAFDATPEQVTLCSQVNKNCDLKICDFGLARGLGTDEDTGCFSGSVAVGYK